MNFDYIWPWPKDTVISQPFGSNPNLNGDPNNPNPGGGHTGTDGALPAGTPLRAPRAGRVTFEGWAVLSNNPYWLTDGGGICLAIDYGDGMPASIMGHLSATFVSVGDWVEQGQIVAESGNTGRWTTGPHCHFEFLPPVYTLNSPTYGRVDPAGYCTGYYEDTIDPVLEPYQRLTATKVWQRTAPDHRNDGNRVKLWDEDLIFDFKGWIRGSDPFGDGNDVWFAGKYSDVYMHSSGFKDMGVHDLPEILPAPPPPPPAEFTLKGIDVSSHQQGIRLDVLGYDFALIKATEGVGYVSPTLDEMAAGVGAKRRGFYHFARFGSTPDNTPEAEAAWFIGVVSKVIRPGDVLVLDLEKDDIDPGKAETFLGLVEDAFGGHPYIYLNSAAINGHDWTNVENRWPLWLAAYVNADRNGFNPPPTKHPTVWEYGFRLWQYTSTGNLPGYAGALDLNAYYGTFEDWDAAGTTRKPVAPEVPVPPVEPPPVVVEPPAVRVPPVVTDPISSLLDYYKE